MYKVTITTNSTKDRLSPRKVLFNLQAVNSKIYPGWYIFTNYMTDCNLNIGFDSCLKPLQFTYIAFLTSPTTLGKTVKPYIRAFYLFTLKILVYPKCHYLFVKFLLSNKAASDFISMLSWNLELLQNYIL